MWGPGWSPDVAHALLRAVSRLISTPALLFDTVCESCARTGRREESRRGTQECVRYVFDHLPHSGSSGFLDIRRSEPWSVAGSDDNLAMAVEVAGVLPLGSYPFGCVAYPRK